MEVASRPGVCGDGRELVGYRNALFARNFQTYGTWSAENCVSGPLRISVTRFEGEITRVRTQVGGPWPRTEERVTDLGVVPPEEASPYFFSLVPSLERGDKDRILLPAVLADADPPLRQLLALARNNERRLNTRRSAIHWLGTLGDETVLAPLMQFAQTDDDDLGGSALAALSMLDGAAGDSAARWMIARALDQTERRKLRKDALFWAGQNADTPTSDLVRVYNTASAEELREHAIFVLSQRQDRAATDALLRIAEEDSDKRMAGKALFWLAQKDDARVRKLLADIILKP
jgi:HEAT repeat protein